MFATTAAPTSADEPVIAEAVGDVQRKYIRIGSRYQRREFGGREPAAGGVELRRALKQLGDALERRAGAEALDAGLDVQRRNVRRLVERLRTELLAPE
jgi:hypothetical protein